MRGTELLVGLNKLRDKHSIIGDVRGKGLMIGMEMEKIVLKRSAPSAT